MTPLYEDALVAQLRMTGQARWMLRLLVLRKKIDRPICVNKSSLGQSPKGSRPDT